MNAVLLAIWFKPATTPDQQKQACFDEGGLGGGFNPLGLLRLFTRDRKLGLLTVVTAMRVCAHTHLRPGHICPCSRAENIDSEPVACSLPATALPTSTGCMLTTCSV